MGDNRLYFNGINGATGAYLLEPRTPDQLAEGFIKGAQPPENEREILNRHRRKTVDHLGVRDGVDPLDLAQAGWAIIFARDDSHTPDILDALKPLLDLRRTQAGDHYCEFHGEKGVGPGESKSRWLARMGVGPGPADPDKLPYYLLLASDPESIPYSFQYQLDVQYAVGRLHFDTLAEYARYAASVVLAESGKAALPRRATFFGVQNLDDPATFQGANELVAPLFDKMRRLQPDWQVDLVEPAAATKPRLARLLGGEETPALLFTESHGLYFPPEDERQRGHGGALLCGEWRPLPPGPVRPDHYLSADDIGDGARLHSLIAFNFACFSAGTPRLDDFAYGAATRGQLAHEAFVARLPQRLLGHPNGGALATIGHVERAFPSSFLWANRQQLATFESTLNKLMKGEPIGFALEFFNERYSELSTVLSHELGEIEFSNEFDPTELAGMWMANNDARNYAICGDPAVRLPLAKNGANAARATITPTDVKEPQPVTTVTAAGSAPQPAAPPAGQGAKPGDGSPFTGVSGMRPFTPFPVAPPEADRKAHPELYAAWVEHVKSGYKNGDNLFSRILSAFLRSHYSTVVMYWLLFTVGLGAVVAGITIALVTGQPVVGLAFAGLGVVAFLTYFISFPTQALEENLLFITWLGVIYNSYWKDLSLSFDPATAQAELDKATEDAIGQLKELIAAYDTAIKRRPRPTLSRKQRDALQRTAEELGQEKPAAG